jgi:DNA-binding MarR family transcriptional regulator
VTPARRKRDVAAPPASSDFACACATARQVARVLTQLYDGRLRGTGMEAPQFALLTTLNKQGPCSQVALGRRYALDKTTVSRNLQWLERKGWIASSSTGDRRERRFKLTADGREQLAAARPEWKKAQAQLRSGMTGKAWDAMFRTFATVTKAALEAGAGRARRRDDPRHGARNI